MKVKLNSADLKATNAQVRFRSLSRKVGTCPGCGRKRLSCSVRLGVCQICFHGAKLEQKGVI